MRERRYIKLKLDIYDDTKTKIIDQKPERDFIHYFFTRSIILAGKSDCEGELYMAKDIPYTIETLAIEFGRDAALVKLALDVLIELKMIEVTEDNIYKVKSFAKHQNIKGKEEAKTNSKEEGNSGENNKEINIKTANIMTARNEELDKKVTNIMTYSNKEANIKEDRQIEDMIKNKTKEEADNRKDHDESIGVTLRHENNEITCNNINNAGIATRNMDQGKNSDEQDIQGIKDIQDMQDIEVASINTLNEENTSANSELNAEKNYISNSNNQQNIEFNSEKSNLVNLEMEDNKKSKKKKNESNLVTELAADEIEDDPPIFFFTDGDMPPLAKGERLVWGLTPV